MFFSAHIKAGLLEPDNPKLWRDFLFGFEGKRISLDVRLWSRKRTLSQNNFYWTYLEAIERETGENANDLHEYFRRIFLKPVERTVLGQIALYPRSTTELNKEEFSEYLDKICARTNIPLPDPELAGYIKN